jgi:ATPase subunit of ABC transporter with duplicated ATPase domains
MADWLEDYLKKWRGALIMVTHDRYFLDHAEVEQPPTIDKT